MGMLTEMKSKVKYAIGEHMVHLGWACWGQQCDCKYGHFYAPLAIYRGKQEDKKFANVTEEEFWDMPHDSGLFFKVTSWMVDTGTNLTVPEWDKQNEQTIE